MLEHKSDFGLSRDENVSGSVLIQAGNEIEDGGLAASRWSENGIERSIRDLETDPVEHAQPLATRQHIFLANVLKCDDAHEKDRYFSSTMIARDAPLRSSSVCVRLRALNLAWPGSTLLMVMLPSMALDRTSPL